jgi:hypothetical protein
MGRDEIGGRGEREPLVPRRARVALGAGALTLAALVGLTRLGGAPLTDPPLTPRPSPAGGPLLLPAPVSLDWVRVASVCAVETAGARRLTVRFVLVNASSRPLTIESVRPVQLLGGLRSSGTWIGGGDCHRLAPQVAAGPVPPGATRLVMLRFRLPRECPGPVMVAARARLSRDSVAQSAHLPSLVMLDASDFASCLVRDR